MGRVQKAHFSYPAVSQRPYTGKTEHSKVFFGKIEFKFDSWIQLDMKSELSGICPFTVVSTKLAVTHSFPAIYNAHHIVLLPKVLDRFLLYRQ